MNCQKKIQKLCGFINKLQDEESQGLFEARLQYFMKRNQDDFYSDLDRILKKEGNSSYGCWRLNSYEKRNEKNRGKDIVIFGAGENGRLTCRSLQYVNRKIHCFVDNNPDLWKTEWNGIPICSLADAKKKYKNSIIVVAVSGRYQMEIYFQLLREGFKESDILMPQEGYLYCDKAGQYFDLKEITAGNEEEFFVDAGCYNGVTSLQYGQLCGDRLKKIYAFEPDHNNYLQCDQTLAQSGYEYELYECGVWSKKDMLNFSSSESAGYASRICRNGNQSIEVDSIDNRLQGRKATYIKYDVEGSELEALRGASKLS